MPITPTFPGVYIEEDASLALSVKQGNTAIPVFIGRFSPKKTSTTPQIIRIASWLDFTHLFQVGCIKSVKITPTLPAKAQSVSEKNESDTDSLTTSDDSSQHDAKDDQTYKVDIAYTTSSDALKLYFQNGGGPCYILPMGDTKQKNLAFIPDLIRQALDITLIVCPEQEADYQSKIYSNLPADLLNEGRFLIADNADKNKKPKTNAPSQTATYYPAVNVPQLIEVEDDAIAVSGYHREIENLTQLNNKENQAVYQQVKHAIQEAIAAQKNVIPASAVVAAVYCATDAKRGVWKAPANVALNGISEITERLTDEEQGIMNANGINAIRYFSQKGFVVWGARTLEDSERWRYISVRRLFNTAERDIKQAMQMAAFEPNHQPTWEKVRSAIDNYLHQLWQQGALAGNSPKEAYFVQIGKDLTMSADEIKQGKMIVKIGMAAVRPAEFIILQFSQDVAQ
ncbi:phage tail sheath protein [Xenorhabdus mauleonii]|uniref:Phage tail sheath protein n=1 Tax=Xenorhabdus mauleonii TaxID=351675 RepID=A0A1I3LPK1_9GAMM|nr:phage tail sheath C-terminal domain-containing protein [Xenorhabdus mauleonii]PHM45256.1 phage tail sheath protein [Xenorhabdus mauleonii]SFI86435.1 hypothetical protein SAMN05421680_10423 [Xenorhabdus mauleonii]